MAAKVKRVGPYLEFHCPGCLTDHSVSVQQWTWNGSMARPTFQPSVKYEGPEGICHFYVEDGKIKFCNDCTAHKLGAQTIEIPDWDQEKKETPMAEKKEFNPGDQVKLLAPHVSGIAAEVVQVHDGIHILRITSSEHPSGHSQEGTVVIFSPDQLEHLESPKVKEVSL